MAHRNAACVWRSKKRTTQRTPSPPCNTVVGVLCCGDQFIWNVESSQGVRNCEKRRICEDLWRQWHNYKSLFYRSKSRFDFGQFLLRHCPVEQALWLKRSLLKPLSSHFFFFCAILTTSILPYIDSSGWCWWCGEYFLGILRTPLFSTEHNWMLMLHFTLVFKHDHPSCSSIHLFTCLHFFNLPM